MSPQPKPVQVLVVDDDAMSRELIGMLLQRAGYIVDLADSGEAALDKVCQAKIRHASFCLVLADVQMPGLSGARLAAELRRIVPRDTLLFAISATRPSEEIIAGFDDFILKPFKVAQITAALSAQNPPLTQAISSEQDSVPADSGANSDALVPVEAPTQPPIQRERWSIVHGPAGGLSHNANLVSISASASPPAASKPSKPTSPAESVLNQTTYRRIAASMPAPKVQEMYTLFVADARKRIALMRQLAIAGDAVRFIREAHAIKGSSGMLGAINMRSIAAQLEMHGLDPAISTQTVAYNVNSLDELSDACDHLQRILVSRARGECSCPRSRSRALNQ
jgi:CheY-like chemotaxis protein/HPt (histidine-containing phosphotransfer) domain-containing protein